METDRVVQTDLAIPPGEYLEEVLEELGITKDELARRMGRPAQKLSPILKGRKAITPDTALQLEKAGFRPTSGPALKLTIGACWQGSNK